MTSPSDEVSTSTSDQSMLSLLIGGVARGLAVWAIYLAVLTLCSWVAFLFVARDLWHGMGGIPAARAGGFGAALALVVLLAYPQTWVTLLYAFGFPAGGFLLGKKAGIATAAARVARGRSNAGASWLTSRVFPVCQGLARTPGTTAVRDVTRALLAAVAPANGRRIRRWFLARLLATLRVPELCMTSGFLVDVREQPGQARASMQRTLESRLLGLTQVNRFRALWITLTSLVVLTASHPLWVPLVRILSR